MPAHLPSNFNAAHYVPRLPVSRAPKPHVAITMRGVLGMGLIGLQAMLGICAIS